MDYEAMLQAWAPRLIDYAVQAVGVLLLLFVAWLVAGWAGRVTRRGLDRAKVDQTLTKFFGNMARYVVLVAAVLMALSVFGIAGIGIPFPQRDVHIDGTLDGGAAVIPPR